MTHAASPSTADTDWFLYSWRLRCIDSSPWQSFPRQHLITDHCWLTDVRHGQVEPFDKQPRLVKPSSAFTYLYLWSHLINSRFSWNLSQSRLIWARFRFQSVMPINHPIDSCLGPVTRWTYKEYYPTSPTMPYDHLLCTLSKRGVCTYYGTCPFPDFSPTPFESVSSGCRYPVSKLPSLNLHC